MTLRLRPRNQLSCFNPRPYVRGDEKLVRVASDTELFQSAPLREGRWGRRLLCDRKRIRFNPRPYVRGDGSHRSGTTIPRSFNPRPYVRGDDGSVCRCRPDSACFNPRPYVRGDAETIPKLDEQQLFQSAPLREGRWFTALFRSDSTFWFQSAPLREGRCIQPSFGCLIKSGFNPRPYVRGDEPDVQTIRNWELVSIRAPT